jgi:hypothetical protein
MACEDCGRRADERLEKLNDRVNGLTLLAVTALVCALLVAIKPEVVSGLLKD